jgi:hypothetical protein
MGMPPNLHKVQGKRGAMRRLLSLDSVVAGLVCSATGVALYSANEEGQRDLRSATPSSVLKYRESCFLTGDHVKELQTKGFIVIDNVLTKDELSSARRDIQRMSARLGESPNDDSSIRTDNICFLRQGDRDEVLARRIRLPTGTLKDEDNGVISDGNSCNNNGEGLLHVQRLLRGLANRLEELQFIGFPSSEASLVSKVLTLFVPDQCQVASYNKVH